ncbi:MAG: 30S ribosomal protein S6 [Nitrospinae bacterium]|nr:30S ribosomal protein S6 [Nitrospinota bacterium]
MVHYECMLILKGDLEEQQVDDMAGTIKGLIEKDGGSVLSLEKLGKKRLAYRVNKNRYGNYILTYFEADPEKIKQLDWNFKLNENIAKNMIIKITKEELDDALSGKTSVVANAVEAQEAAVAK